MGRDFIQSMVEHSVQVNTQREGARVFTETVRGDRRRRRGAAVRAGDVPGGVALPAAAAPRRAPLREGLQHRQAVQALLLQARRAVPEHGGPQQRIRGLHRRFHEQHIRHGRDVRPEDPLRSHADQHQKRAQTLRKARESLLKCPEFIPMRNDGVTELCS